MRTIIAGSRTVTKSDVFRAMFLCGISHRVTTVISGTAKGADEFGEAWAKFMGLPIEQYPADWNKHGKSAGYQRNAEMAKVADICVVVWDGESRGSKNMMDLAKKTGLLTIIYHAGERKLLT